MGRILGKIATPVGILKAQGPLGNTAAPTGILKAQGDCDAGQPLPTSANKGNYLPQGFLPVNADVHVLSSSKQWLPATLCGVAICNTNEVAAGTLHIRYRGVERRIWLPPSSSKSNSCRHSSRLQYHLDL